MSSEETIFAEATQLPVSERETFLRNACGENKALQARLIQLLSAHECENVFLDVAETHSTPQIQDLNEGDSIGAYRLLKKLGEGGFGVVYLAEQQHPIHRQVAIKIIKPGMDSQAVVARFESERQALALMDHPNIAHIFDGGASDKDRRPYFVMELVQGTPITEFCDANSLSTGKRLELFVSVCKAVHHAHQKGIIHRDIKPSNVMVTLNDGEPVVKVIDFGVAKALNQQQTGHPQLTQCGMMVGTPQYMSPEQAEMNGLDVDTRSDIYSLCVLLFELIAGTTPLDRQVLVTAGLQELRRMICEDEPVRPSLSLSFSREKLSSLAKLRNVSPERLLYEVKGDLDWITMKGLEKDRNRRYESAKELALDIERALHHKPVLAGPPSVLYRAKKFVRRNRIPLTLSTAAVVMVVAILLGLFNHQQHQLAAAEKEETELTAAIEHARAALVDAIKAPNSNEDWTAAELLATRVDNLLDDSLARKETVSRGETFLQNYEQTRKDRTFAHSMEELLIRYSTNQSVESLQSMEQGFRKILKNRGYDLRSLSPEEIASQLKRDHTPIKLTDALELWLVTRMKLTDANAAAQEITSDEMERWTKAMNSVDPNPLRIAIRQTIFQTVEPEKATLDEAVDAGDLTMMCARKLSWLAQAYEQVGDPERAAEIRDFALGFHSNDLILNFENANRLMNQERFDEAIRYLMRCTSIRPGNSGVWKKLAESLAKNDELNQAQRAISIAIDLDPNDAESHLYLAKWSLLNNMPQQAISSAKHALRLDNSLHRAWEVIGRSNMSKGAYQEAMAALEEFQKRASEREKRSARLLIIECQKQISVPQSHGQ